MPPPIRTSRTSSRPRRSRTSPRRSRPQWPFAPATGMFSMDNYPYNHQQTWYFVAVAEDQFGNVTPDDRSVHRSTRRSSTEPPRSSAWPRSATTARPSSTPTCVTARWFRPAPSIDIFVYQQVAPLPGRFDDADGIGWVGGLDRKTGQAGFDDDDDGSIDEDDVDGDGIFTAGIDDDGADDVPGHRRRRVERFAPVSGNLGETDDYVTNDIVQVIFQVNPVGDDPDQGWITFATVHGDDSGEPGHRLDRAGQGDVEHPRPRDRRLRPAGVRHRLGRELQRDHGVHHDRRDPERPAACLHPARGLHRRLELRSLRRAPHPRLRDRQGPLRVLLRRERGQDRERRQRVDGDRPGRPGDRPRRRGPLSGVDRDSGFGSDRGSRLPDVRGDGTTRTTTRTATATAGAIRWCSRAMTRPWTRRGVRAMCVVIAATDADIPTGATLTAFAADEFWAEASGESNGLEPTDWIFRENELTGDQRRAQPLERLAGTRPACPEGNYLVWSIAIDENNLEDVITYNSYDPTQQNPEEIELVRIDTVLPNTNITT
ncbi:MAG: hypothetical protein MZV65_29040 [Chromatiales bacterium]|nr:hypothetical protein [Chromatiales bacterium]